jgi:hypothetical protein
LRSASASAWSSGSAAATLGVDPASSGLAQRLLEIGRELALLVVDPLGAFGQILERLGHGGLALRRELLQRFL